MENEENRGLIKILWGSAGKILTGFGGALFYTLSLILLDTYSFLDHSWRSVAYLEFLIKKEKEE